MRVMELPMRPRAIEDLQAASAVGQGKLYRVYDELLRERGVTSAQVLLTFFDMSARTHYLNARQTLRRLLEWRVVPVINENDTTTTDEISFGDNDFLAAQVAILIGADRLVLLTDTDGLYTADPRTDPAAELRRARSPTSRRSDGLAIGHATSPLGSRRDALEGRRGRDGDRGRDPGGRSATACGRARSARCSTAAAGGHALPGRRRRATRASSCGCATPSRRTGRSSSTRARRGRCARAARRCCRSAIVDVRGGFDAGDAVHVTRGRAGHRQGHLRTTPPPELRRVMGMKSAQVREVLPRATDEAVHRDYFVLV